MQHVGTFTICEQDIFVHFKDFCLLLASSFPHYLDMNSTNLTEPAAFYGEMSLWSTVFETLVLSLDLLVNNEIETACLSR